jgi:D-alanyl-lipoteichoic acid acyltransferase DltB (MBOAT superfamily)
MLIGGLWHGASWMFVLWGALHGTYLVIERLLLKKYPALFSASIGWNILIGLVTFIIVTLTWIPFRAHSIDDAAIVFKGLIRVTDTSPLDLGDYLAIAVMLLALRWQIYLRNSTLEEVFARAGAVLQTCIVATCLLGLFLFSGGDQRAFIYFQF